MKLSALTFAVLLLAQQQPQQQQPQAARGRIEGTVLRENTMEGVSGARVTVTRVNASTGAALPVAGTIQTFLINPSTNVPPAPGPAPNAPPPPNPPPPQPAPIPPATTDRAGKFVVPDLEPGAYRVAVTLNGYVKQEYGQRSFTGQGTSLTLSAGEILKDLVIRITRAGNISGRISDENGQPASGVPVQVLKVAYNANGTRLFQQTGTARTNDRGEYRLYWMTPGRYYLTAGTPAGPAPGAGPGGAPSPNETPDPYTFTYYPGTTDLSRATVIDVKAGADMPMDFTVPRTRLFNVSGRVVGADNSAIAPQVGISLAFLRLEGGSGFVVLSQSYDRSTGVYTLRNVVPGSYAVQANAGATSARAAIEVTNADVNVDLILSGGVNIAGKATVAGGGAIPSGPGNQTVVQLRPIMKGVSHWVGAVPGAPVTPADGTFRMDRVLPGEYRVVAGAPGHYVKELRYENADVLNSTVEVSAGRSGDPTIEVVLSPGVAQIDGIVTDDKNQPLMGAQAVLIPDKNRHRTELFKAATTDQSGRFNMRDVAPGDYKLFAWESVDNFGYFEPSFLAPYEQLGKTVRVDEGGKLTIETKVIPDKR
jgi:hypothetical protein